MASDAVIAHLTAALAKPPEPLVTHGLSPAEPPSLAYWTSSTRVGYAAEYARFALTLREFASAVDQCCRSSL